MLPLPPSHPCSQRALLRGFVILIARTEFDGVIKGVTAGSRNLNVLYFSQTSALICDDRATAYVFLTAISTAPQSSSEQEPFAYCARGGGVAADEILGLGGRRRFCHRGDMGRTFRDLLHCLRSLGENFLLLLTLVQPVVPTYSSCERRARRT